LVSVAKESGQTAATVLFENIAKMYSRMPARNRRNAAWYINQGIEPQLFSMSISVGTGGVPVYLPAGGVSGQPYGMLFGRPVIPIEQCAALGTVGDIIFADLSSYILADKGGIDAAVSIHVRFIFDESVFRFVYRVDGQPSLASAITPFDGGSALSPFVALATRS
jgi:HK97 family phage major capsid protein